MKKWNKTIKESFGQILVVECDTEIAYEEIVEVKKDNGEIVYGKVIEAKGKTAVVQVYGDSVGVSIERSMVHFTGHTQKMGVSEDMIGRVFSGYGSLIDGGPEFVPDMFLDINGAPINPYSRTKPFEFVQTGISSIDVMINVVKGQKLPIFSIAGLPHAKIAAQIARQAEIGTNKDDTVIIFGAIGVSYEESNFFIEEFRNSGALSRSVLFLNLASDPVVERITLPRLVLTTAEYLAFEKGKQVLVIMTDITNYCNALREVSAARKEIPGRRGYPGYMYTDLAMLYERAGTVSGSEGSITQIPILTMIEGDKTHPIADLTGYITEGQIVLSKGLDNKSIFPPVNVLDSLSRLKVAKGLTRDDHDKVASQLRAAYSKGKSVKDLAQVLGESSLTEDDRKYIKFVDEFEKKFISQREDENRSLVDSLTIAWELLSILPRRDLKKVKPEQIEKYLPNQNQVSQNQELQEREK